MRALEVVYIKWIDSEASNEWTPVEEFIADLSMVHTIGILIHFDADIYVVASSYDPMTDSINAVITIPRAATKEITTLSAINPT